VDADEWIVANSSDRKSLPSLVQAEANYVYETEGKLLCTLKYDGVIAYQFSNEDQNDGEESKIIPVANAVADGANNFVGWKQKYRNNLFDYYMSDSMQYMAMAKSIFSSWANQFSLHLTSYCESVFDSQLTNAHSVCLIL
jgi:hypothetical protein